MVHHLVGSADGSGRVAGRWPLYRRKAVQPSRCDDVPDNFTVDNQVGFSASVRDWLNLHRSSYSERSLMLLCVYSSRGLLPAVFSSISNIVFLLRCWLPSVFAAGERIMPQDLWQLNPCANFWPVIVGPATRRRSDKPLPPG